MQAHKRQKLKGKKQQGSALISALLMMSIVTMLAVGMISRQDLEIRRTESIFHQERLLVQANWVELWARGILDTVSKQLTPENDYITLDQIWALPLEEFQQEGVFISGQIFDLQSFFNVNNVLVNTSTAEQTEEGTAEQALSTAEKIVAERFQQPVERKTTAAEEKKPTPADFLTDENLYTPAWMFTRLVENQAEIPAVQSRALTESLLYWLMPDVTEMDNYYLKLEHPYRPSHQSLWSVSELRLVQGMDNHIFNAIKPFLSAIPNPNATPEAIPVNINTTTPEVLAAILNIGVMDASSVLGLRPYYTKESLQEQINKKVREEKGGGNVSSLLDITSHYFLVRAEVRDERRKFVQYSILHRNQEGRIEVMTRVQGEL